MNKTILKIFTLAISLLAGPLLIAQDTISYPQYTVAIQPFYLADGGLRFDFEKQLGSPKQWLQLGIAGYYLSDKSNNPGDYWETISSGGDNIMSLKGAGIWINRKAFIPSSRFVYISGGLSYKYLDVGYTGRGYIPYIEDGMQFYEYSDYKDNQVFNKVTGSLCLGLQTSLRYRIILDTYLGLGYTYSFYDEDKPSFNHDMFGYGYRGVTLIGGIRLGVTFGRK